MRKRIFIIAIAAAVIAAVGLALFFAAGGFGRSKVLEARKSVEKISGTPAGELILSDESSMGAGIIVLSDTIANYKYDLANNRLLSMSRRDRSEIMELDPDGTPASETRAKDLAMANYNRYSQEIKDPVIGSVKYNSNIKIYYVDIKDEAAPGFSSGNSTHFDISTGGVIVGVANHYEDRSITANIDYSKIVSKEEAIRLAKEKDKAGDLTDDNIDSLLTASMGRLVWLIYPKGEYGSIHTFTIDAHKGTVSFVTPKLTGSDIF